MHGARARRPAAASGSALQCTFVRWATVGGGRARADQLRAKLPKLAALKDEVEPDVPAPHRVKLHSTDPIKRRNGEIKRRTEVFGIFPNEGLVVTILFEQNDEWAVQRARYMTLKTIAPLSNDP